MGEPLEGVFSEAGTPAVLRNGSAVVHVSILVFFAIDIIDLAAAAAAAAAAIVVVVAAAVVFSRFVSVGVGRFGLTSLVAVLIAPAATFAAVSSVGADPPR
jgi:hypothetical protein